MGRTYNFVPATSLDYRRLAEQRLPRFLFDYIDGGANDELTLRRNVEDFQSIRVRQHVMRDVSDIDTSTTLLGETVAMPVVLAPVGMAGLYSRRGELHALRASDVAGIPFTLSTLGICSLEELRAQAKKPFWFQQYMIRDRKAVRSILERAMANGCTTLIFTVDMPVAGMRYRDTRNGMLTDDVGSRLGRAWQLGQRPRWLYDVGVRGKPHTFGCISDQVSDPTNTRAVKAWVDSQYDPAVTWADIAWLRGIWQGKLVIKGILEADDARAALDAGADGVVISNHGGRQLDSVASTISKLPAVIEAVGGRLEVFMDGGVRGGMDVFKAVALGATGVLIGRPWAWAIAGRGEAGLVDLLATFKRELAVAMALTGARSISEVHRGLVEWDRC